MPMQRPLSVLLLVVGLAFGAGGTAHAEPTSEAASFVQDLVNQAMKSIDNKQLTEQDRANQFRELLGKDFDMPRIGRFVLGRYWNSASDDEKQQFQQLFQEYVVRAYAQRF